MSRVKLFETIRREHRDGASIRGLADDHGVHRRTVRQAIDNLGFPSNRGGLLIDGCILSLIRVLCCWVASWGLDVAVERWLSCCAVLSGSVGEDLFVGNGRFHLAAGVPASVVVAVDEFGDLPAGLGFGRELST